MNMMGIIDKINKPNGCPGDYTGADGLLYCGRCQKPKQIHGSGILEGKLLSIPCECMQREIDAEREQEKRRKADELRAVCLPVKAMHKHTFERADDSKHVTIARRYVEEWERMRAQNIGLLFWGNTGTGKSYTAHCIANALLDRQIPVKLVSAVELVARLMEKEGREEYIKRLQDAPLLIIDDIGAERDTAFSREQLCAVIDARSECGRPLIVTTNYGLTEMRECTDHALQRIFDRLTALCVPVSVVGQSRRGEIGSEKINAARTILGL